MTIKAANHKFNVLVEKPMALTLQDCQKMNEAATQNHVKLWVVKQNRHNVPVKLTKDAIDKGMLGKIFMIKCD
ncbi:Gfo/Idh/MocA family oxidoreductase, partial [Acinetobacter baumannii]|uniref:Gfo/Idh/MocA family oxidoreductase n=1 Tax=Acinetobacter baumannii TaxID=470 RepID=UPI0028A21BB4